MKKSITSAILIGWLITTIACANIERSTLMRNIRTQAQEKPTVTCAGPKFKEPYEQYRGALKHRKPSNSSGDIIHAGDMYAWPELTAEETAAASTKPANKTESQTFTLDAYLWQVKVEGNDCEIHLELNDSRTNPISKRVIAEIPPDPPFEKDYQSVLRLIKEQFAPLSFGPDSAFRFHEPIHIRITGFAFFDGIHKRYSEIKGQNGGHGTAPVQTFWELHPAWNFTIVGKGGDDFDLRSSQTRPSDTARIKMSTQATHWTLTRTRSSSVQTLMSTNGKNGDHRKTDDELVDLTLSQMEETERVSNLSDLSLILEIRKDGLDNDPRVYELLTRLNPDWLEESDNSDGTNPTQIAFAIPISVAYDVMAYDHCRCSGPEAPVDTHNSPCVYCACQASLFKATQNEDFRPRPRPV